MYTQNEVIEKLGFPIEEELSDETKARIVKTIICLFEDELLTFGQAHDILDLTYAALGVLTKYVSLVD